MSLPKTFKAYQVTEKGGDFVPVERKLELPKDGQILVKVLACGVCHSDFVAKSGGGGLPRIPGHEIVGDVVAVPDSEKKWKKGDRVGGGWHGSHCFHCNSCRKGDFVTCPNKQVNGISIDGGYAEYVLLFTEAVVSVPTNIEPTAAAPLLCAGVTTYNSLRHMNVQAGDIVAVQGVGGLGHLAIQYASKMGYKTVALSSSPAKKDLAGNLGAHIYLDGSQVDHATELQKMGGAKVVICTAPNPEIVSKLVKGIAPNGTLLLLAITDGLKMDTTPLITNSLTVRGWPSGTAKDSEETIAFSDLAGVNVMIEKYPLSEVNKAYERMFAGKANFRCVVIP